MVGVFSLEGGGFKKHVTSQVFWDMPGIAGSSSRLLSLEPRQFLRHGFSNCLAEDVSGWNFLFV